MNPSESIESAAVLRQLHWRYATKKFDPTRRIPDPIWADLEHSLVLTPSSYGLQPWKFVVITDPDIKESLSVHSWKQSQPRDCSHFVVFAAHRHMDEAAVDKHIQRSAAVRGIPESSLARLRDVIVGDVVHGERGQISGEWAARQVYIALGQFMASCALVGVDACPMEGIVPSEFDEVLGLTDTDYGTAVACAAGYRAADDKYAATPKVRFPQEDVIIRIGS